MIMPAPFARQFETVSGSAKEAVRILEQTGLPGPKTEEFIYTSLRPLTSRSFSAPDQVPEASRVRALMARVLPEDSTLSGLPCLVFVNGVFSGDFSDIPGRKGVHIRTKTAEYVKDKRNLPFFLLNNALHREATEIEIDPGIDAGSYVVLSLSFGTDVSFHPYLHLRAKKGASVVLTEIAAGEGAYLNNPVSVFDVSEHAHVLHTKLQQEDAQAVHMAVVQAKVAEKASYDSFVLSLGSVLSRHEVHADLNGSKAAVHINGAQLLADRQTGDITSVITHAAPDCISRQTVRNVLGGQARGVFQGKIFVDRIAQKTDGYQMNQALLVSDTAEMDSKPMLEIYADDVKCSHGATVGALDTDQLFYIRSRGVPEAEARRILIGAFLDDVLELVTDENARGMLHAALFQVLKEKIGVGGS